MSMNITQKMVIMLLVTSILLVGAMAAAMNWSFQKGFLGYLTEAEMAGLDDTVERLSNAYRREGSWDFIRGNHRVWSTFLPLNEEGRPIMPADLPPLDSSLASGSSEGQVPAPVSSGIRPPPLPPDDRSGLSTRLRLLDADRNRLIGPPDTVGKGVLRPILLEGEVVGWLSLSPQPAPGSDIDRSFRDEQLNAIYPIGVGALLLALIIGIPLGRHLLIPVKDVARGAHALAQGRYETRLEPRSNDELGRLALDFNALAEALQRNELLRRQGMTDISHELRTPLALLRGEIEAMQDGIRPTDLDQLGKLHDSIMQFSRLVDDLYDLALTDVGALSYRMASLDLSEVLRQAVVSAEHRAGQKGLSLQVEITDRLPVLGDARRLRQVVDNLLKNSRRYTDPGGVIEVSAWKAAGRAYFKIEDSVPGVGREILSRLFERFYRAEGSRSRASGGAGLGLAICRNIIDAHQGSIGAKPSSLGGLQIVVSLPLDEPAARPQTNTGRHG